MKNHTWTQLEPGQIVTFTYKSKNEKKGFKRTIMVLNPRYRYKKKNGRTTFFVVGLQLDTQIKRPITSTKLEKLISEFGGLQLDSGIKEIGRFDDNTTQAETKKIYKSLKDYIEKYKIFRTFNLRECRKRRVYLEDTWKRLPKDSLDDLSEEQKAIEFEI